MTTTLGIVGYPLTHSFSPEYFKKKMLSEGIEQTQYLAFPMDTLDGLRELTLDYPDLNGLNVTIPYKERIIPFLDELDDSAKAVGAVNTILITNGQWVGYNTDIFGFKCAIQDWLDGFQIRSALILGSGGAAKAARYVLENESIATRIISRSSIHSYGSIDEKLLKATDLIVNATPLGMYPEVDSFPPIPYSFISPKHFLFDMIYNPEKTIFLARGASQGAQVRNGLSMLHQQAEKAWDIWQRNKTA